MKSQRWRSKEDKICRDDLRGVRIRHHAQNNKERRKIMMSFAEIIEQDNQFDRFLFEGGNDPFGEETDSLIVPKEE